MTYYNYAINSHYLSNYVYCPSKSTLDYKITENGENKVHTLTWSIPRFLSITNCKYIKSYKTEYVDNIQEKQFALLIEFCGVENDFIEIYYLYTECVVIKVNINLFGYSEYKIRKDTTTPNLWIRNKLLDIKKVTACCSNNDGQFKISCEFVIISSNSMSNVTEPVYIEHDELYDDLECLLNSNKLSDVTLKSIEGFEFKVHKAILSSRSTVLKAHFEHDTIENQTNTIESQLETEVLREVLSYIYTDRAPKVQAMADKLLAAAEFYNLSKLKKISAEMLYLKLTKDNAIETLQLADIHNVPHLTKLTLEFIKDGNAGLITETDGWKSINSVNVIKTLYKVVVDDLLQKLKI